MQLTCTHITSLHRNVTVLFATQVVKKVVGVKALIIARSSARPTVHHNALKEDVSDQSLENAVIW